MLCFAPWKALPRFCFWYIQRMLLTGYYSMTSYSVNSIHVHQTAAAGHAGKPLDAHDCELKKKVELAV